MAYVSAPSVSELLTENRAANRQSIGASVSHS
jgi:hypothetical protein